MLLKSIWGGPGDSMKNRLATWCAIYVQLYECDLCVLIALRGIQHRLDSTGLHWALACALRGSPGLSWASGLSWALFWLGRALLEASVLFCALLGSLGLSWARLGSSGFSWTRLGSPGLYWVHSGFTGLVWILPWSMWSYSDYDL